MRQVVLGFALTFLAVASLPAQELLRFDQYCLFDGATLGDELYGFESDRAAQEALARVMRHTGLEPNFIIKAASVPNAAAVIQGQARLILYNQNFMLQVRNATNSDWSMTSILAHEIGHHLQGHTLDRSGSRPAFELEADKYSGFILQRMGATLDHAQAAMRTVANDQGSATHPGKQARLAAITNGWVAAKELNEKKPDATPPNPNPAPQPTDTTQSPPPTGQQAPRYIMRAVFPGDINIYYITSADDIVMVTPVGQAVIVGKKIPPTVMGFVWMYSTTYITYGVTQDGRIWNRNQFGQPFQVGYVTNP